MSYATYTQKFTKTNDIDDNVVQFDWQQKTNKITLAFGIYQSIYFITKLCRPLRAVIARSTTVIVVTMVSVQACVQIGSLIISE